MKKLTALVMVVAMLLCAFAMAEEIDYTKVPEGMTVGFINYTDANDTPQQFHQGIADWCEANGVELLYAEASGDAEAMMSACDNFILQEVDIIIDSNWNLAGGSALVQKCNEAGIPLISLDTYYEGANSYYVGVDNDYCGVIAGEAAAKWINSKFGGTVDYVVVSYAAALEGINVRTTNVISGIREAGIEVADENYFELECGTGDATQLAKQQMTDWLTAHPEGTVAAVGGNCEITLGFQAAVESQNRADDVVLVSHNLDVTSKAALDAGSELWVAAVDYMPYYYAQTAMPLAVRLVNGERPEEVMHYVQIQFVDADNYAEIIAE